MNAALSARHNKLWLSTPVSGKFRSPRRLPGWQATLNHASAITPTATYLLSWRTWHTEGYIQCKHIVDNEWKQYNSMELLEMLWVCGNSCKYL